MSGGTLAPISVAILTFSAAEITEGAGNIYLGITGDGSSIAFNPTRDTLFMGNQDVYNVASLAVNIADMKLSKPKVSSLDDIAQFGAKSAETKGINRVKDLTKKLLGKVDDVGDVKKGSKAVGKGGKITLNHKATSGVKLISTPGKTTTILGRFDSDTGAIIKELNLPKSTNFGGNQDGFNLLNTPDELYTKLGPDGFWKEYNRPFLDAAINRGDEILMATPINNSTLYTKSGELTGYGREYYYLRSRGYEYVDGKMILKGVK